MVSDERTPLLGHVVLLVPKECVAATVVATQPVLPVAAISSDVWSGLTNRELLVLAQDPFWVRLRSLTFWGFWLCWMVLFLAAMAVVVTSPPCPVTDCGNSTTLPPTDLPTTMLLDDSTTLPPTDLPTTVTLEAWTTLVPR